MKILTGILGLVVALSGTWASADEVIERYVGKNSAGFGSCFVDVLKSGTGEILGAAFEYREIMELNREVEGDIIKYKGEVLNGNSSLSLELDVAQSGNGLVISKASRSVNALNGGAVHPMIQKDCVGLNKVTDTAELQE